MGVPFLPVRGLLGSAYLDINPRFRVIPDPFAAADLALVQALSPDVTLVHGAKGDEQGNLLIPRVSDWILAIRASRTTLATVEERVPGPLQEEADWQFVPAIHLTALVHLPGGAAPTGFPGYYTQDEAHILNYILHSKDPAAFAAYLQEVVYRAEQP
jgi:glutaconate CoA-transferase subunit A